MTAHLHSTITPGCYRCELGKDEAASAAIEMLHEASREVRARKGSMYPKVAARLADWLDSVAAAMTPPSTVQENSHPDRGRSIHPADESWALEVARAYLGEDA